MDPNVRTVLNAAAAALDVAGVPDAATEAAILVGQALGKPRTWLYAWPEAGVNEAGLAAVEALVARRSAGEPVAQILGRREFWSLTLEVTPSTLIPRPETELAVERTLALVPEDRHAHIADMGTGSGAIAAAIACERPHWRILATDIDPEALEVARRNFRVHRLNNVETRHGEWTRALDEERFDLIVSNPPYIADSDPHLETGDLRFEPRGALASGPDGLDALKRIVSAAPAHLVDGGWLILEHGFDQGAAVRDLLVARGFDQVKTHRDLAGHERVTEGRLNRPGENHASPSY